MKQLETVIKEAGIKGKFIKEIKERYQTLFRAMIEIGLEKEEYGAIYGIYKAKINFKEENRLKEIINLLEETNIEYTIKGKKTLIVKSKEEKEKIKIKVYEKRTITFKNTYESFEEIEKIINGLKRDYKKVKNIVFMTKYIVFMEEIEREETEEEMNNRIEKEDKEYINYYKEMSKRYDEFKEMKNIFEGYEE
jgi:hypothetical protein